MSDTVLIGGVFDPLHAGHLAYIREAQTHGDVVCVLSDAPEKHPVLVPMKERADLLMALGIDTIACDHVCKNATWALEYYRPKKYIKGKDWEGRLPPEEVAICNSLGIEIVYTDTSRQSSSQLLADYERRRNAQTLKSFEDWVRQQQPADKPWEPVTPYDRETRRAIEAPQADIIAEVFKGCTVLDYGCGFGYLVELLRERGMSVEGFDPYQPAFTRGPVNADLVVCREVLEHLSVVQLKSTVEVLVRRANKFIYVTTRFTSKSHLLDFDLADGLDPTHITLLNQDLLRTLFALEGCTRRPDLEAKLDHMKKGRVLVYEVPA